MNKKGFLISDYVITLLVLTIIFNIMIQTFSIISKYQFMNQKLQDELMIYHIRKIMLVADNIEVTHDNIKLKYNLKDRKLYQANDKLILSDGVQVLLDKVLNVKFYIDNNIIYLEYTRNNTLYKRGIKKL